MAKTRTKTTKPAMSSLAALSSKKAKVAKIATPTVVVTKEKQLLAMQAIVDAKNAKKAAESAMKAAEHDLRDDATNHFENRCRSDGTLHTSIRLTGTLRGGVTVETPSILYTQPRTCLTMEEAEATDPLRNVFGDEFDNLFAFKQTIKINADILSKEQIDDVLTVLQDALGDQYDEAIDSDCYIEPREGFFGRRMLDPRIRKLADRASEDGYAVLKAASFKL